MMRLWQHPPPFSEETATSSEAYRQNRLRGTRAAYRTPAAGRGRLSPPSDRGGILALWEMMISRLTGGKVEPVAVLKCQERADTDDAVVTLVFLPKCYSIRCIRNGPETWAWPATTTDP